MDDAPCRICGNADGNATFTAREMMLGLRDRFTYGECARCGALQILDPPADLSRYYADGYYSFAAPYRTPPLRRWLKRRQARHVLGSFDPVGALVAALRPAAPPLDWLARTGVRLDASILDVGAGSGQLLVGLREYGFRRLLGIDPFLDADLEHPDGVRVLRAELEDVEGAFDLVMFHHSFEHVADPDRTLALARDRLATGGTILIRTPVAGRSWKEYGADWVELDAPRHLHIHTPRSIGVLAARHGLRVEAVDYDTDAFELWGSEQYRRGIPLHDPRSHAHGGRGAVFSTGEMRAFEERAAALNRSGEAGRAAFRLRRA